MGRVAVVTDSNSGITQNQAEALGLSVLPMPFTMDGETFFEDINLTQETFYEKLLAGADISTSQPSTGNVLELWNRLLETHDELVHIPMSGALSASCESAELLSRDFDGRVQVVNNLRISVTQRRSALDAAELASIGWPAKRIKERLEQNKFDTSIYIMLDTLKFLKKGGRVTPAGAALGTLLNIKPVLQIQGGKLDAYAKVRGIKHGRTVLLEAMQKDFEGKFYGSSGSDKMCLDVAYTYDAEAAESFKREVEAVFRGYEMHVAPLSLSVSCHIGPGALALACTKKLSVQHGEESI